ncbi:MAG TPA: sodium:proton antiporter, partial [Bacteroidales bacterium]|nr:sodium:proton antiporter [Bacteroidales bacterium]
MTMANLRRKPKLIEALIPLVFLTILITINVMVFGVYSLDGSNQIVLLVSAGIAGLMAIRLGFTWDE